MREDGAGNIGPVDKIWGHRVVHADAGALNAASARPHYLNRMTVTCNAFPCTVTITILGPPKVAGDLARKTKPAILAKGRFTIPKAGPRKLTIHLNGAGKRFFKARHGTVKVKGMFADTFKGRTVTSTKTIRIKIARTHHH